MLALLLSYRAGDFLPILPTIQCRLLISCKGVMIHCTSDSQFDPKRLVLTSKGIEVMAFDRFGLFPKR